MILGFMLGFIAGSFISWLAYTWLEPIDLEETGTRLFPLQKKEVSDD
jgi:hypothetical protein